MTDKVFMTEPYWYRQYIGECPVCGLDQGWEERVSGQAPEDESQRRVYLSEAEAYCCGGCV